MASHQNQKLNWDVHLKRTSENEMSSEIRTCVRNDEAPPIAESTRAYILLPIHD